MVESNASPPIKKSTSPNSSIELIGTPFPGGGAVISVRNLSYWYSSKVIGLNNVSLDIGTGVVGLLGPNGAGKSTFLKLLTGQLGSATGHVHILGKDIRVSTEVYAEIGFVPELDSFYENMTGLQFVTHLTRLQGFSHADAEYLAREAIHTLCLTEKQHQRIKTYSKGMRQRIKIAQAIAHKPQVLFFDEPLTGTDPLARHNIIELIIQLGEEGRTVVVSGHVLHEIESMTATAVFMDRSRIVADGNLREIRALLSKFPRTIHIESDQPRLLAATMSQLEGVVSVNFQDDSVDIRTNAPEICFGAIPRIAIENNLKIKAFYTADDNLQSIFEYLIH